MEKSQNQIAERMRTLICPPDGISVTGGKQLTQGNQYPNESNIDLIKHIKGEATFAIDVVYKDHAGTETCKWGVIDIDEDGDEGFQKAIAVKEHLSGEGISTLVSFSGRKGYHVYVFTEPVPKGIMLNSLKKIRQQFSFKGEAIPGDGNRCKPAPCLHQVSGHMSYLISDQPYQDTFNMGNLPDGFYQAQLSILEGITPTSANVLVQYAVSNKDSNGQKNMADMIPDLNPEDDYMPPCINALVQNGGSAKLNTYDKNNLTLMGFCKSKGLSEERGIQLAEAMSKNAENGPVNTTKDHGARVQHFKTIADVPSVNDTPFSCAFMLKARSELKFDCASCNIRPKGVKVEHAKDGKSGKLVLEDAIARDLMAFIIQKGSPVENIAPEIMPDVGYKSDALKGTLIKGVLLPGILLRVIKEGAISAVAIARWFDQNIRNQEELLGYIEMSSSQFEDSCRKYGTNYSAFHLEMKNETIHYFECLSRLEKVDEDTFQGMLNRAIDLSRRYYIVINSMALTQDSYDFSKDIFTVNSEYTHQSNQMLAGSQGGTLVPITDEAEHLIEYILGGGSGITETPFTEFNDLLGGGLTNGCLYMLVSPPGGGKTTFASQIADHAAQQGIPVIFISMEMSKEQIFVNSMARAGEINSAKIMSPYPKIKEAVLDEVGKAADSYFDGIGQYLHIIEGNIETTPAKIEALVSLLRAKYSLTKKDPILIVIDYLQLLNTGKEFLDTSPNETLKISELAVRCKQLARDSSVAVLAISDITKEQQEKNYNSKEFTLNSLRGSNRIAHAADTVIALYSESSEAEGGKSKHDPWDAYVQKINGSEEARDFVEAVINVKNANKIGGDGATAYARLELIKNRGGQGKGSQFLLYHRAHHKFEPVTLDGQAKAEGRS